MSALNLEEHQKYTSMLQAENARLAKENNLLKRTIRAFLTFACFRVPGELDLNVQDEGGTIEPSATIGRIER